MPIKTYLRNLGVTLKELSDRLNLSRPTLDAYINMYENGQELPRDRYQIIFDALFTKKERSREEFEIVLNSYEELLDQDARYGVSNLGVSEADTITDLLNQAKKDLACDDWDLNIYVFINKMLNSYRKEPIFRYLAKYFNTLNAFVPIEEISEKEKPYMALLHKTFSDLQECRFNAYRDSYIAFLKEREKLIKNRNSIHEKQRNDIDDKIKRILEDASSTGIELTQKEVIERLLCEQRDV